MLVAFLALAGVVSPAAFARQATTAATSAAPDAAGFANEYDSATRLMTARNWKGAREAWLALLRRHAGQDYVRPRVEEIRMALRKSAFWLVTKEPAPASLVSGDLRAFAPSSGQIHIDYTAGTLQDFQREDQASAKGGLSRSLFFHPLTFHGSYSLELKGTADELARVALYVALQGDRGYAVQIGAYGEVLYTMHQAVRMKDGEAHPIAKAVPAGTSPKKGKPSDKPRTIKALLKVDPKEIALTYDGDKVFEFENEDRTLGRFGLAASGAFGTLEVKGTIEPSWIDGLQDAFVQSARETFEQTYADPPELAPWKDARPVLSAAERVAALLATIRLPDRFLPEQIAAIDEVTALRDKGQSLQAIARLRSSAQALPASTATLLLTFCEIDLDRPARALASLREHEKLVPLSAELKFLMAHLLGRVEREAEAIEVLSALVAAGSDEPLVHFELTKDLLATGRFDEARAALDRGLAVGGPMAELAELSTQLAKATLGPEWQKTFAHASERFAVASDIDTEICRSAARELDETWEKCNQWFGEVAAPAAPTKVYLFSGEAGYGGYARGIADEGLMNTLGGYSVQLDQIMAWNSTDRELLLRTLRHECVHHYLDLALGPVPRWLDEGLAEYLAVSKLGPRKWEEGAANAYMLPALRAHGHELTSLRHFLRMDDEQFEERADSHYPQAWAFVHFLRRSGDAQAIVFFQRLWRALAERTDAASAVESALEGVDLERLEQAFYAHATRLVAPAEERATR